MDNRFEAETPAEAVAEAVWRDGYAIVERAMAHELLANLKADLAPHLAAAHTGHEAFHGSATRRFGALLAKSKACQALLLHPTVLAAADRALLGLCVRYQVQYTGVMHLEPGEKAQVLHRDTGMYPIANPCPPFTLATMWAVSDFTSENGATRFVPGSHRWPDDRAPEPEEVCAAEMPAGSVLIYTGNTMHGGGANRGNTARTGVALHYSLAWLRQEENQYLAATPDEVRAMPRAVQELMGYSLAAPNLGFVDHVAPLDHLNGIRDPARSNLTPDDMRARANAIERLVVDGQGPSGSRFFPPVDEG